MELILAALIAAQGIAGGSVTPLVISRGLGLMAWNKTQQAELNLADTRGFSSLTLFEKRRLFP